MAVGEVNPVIQTSTGAADLHLRVGRNKAVKPDFDAVCGVVAVVVREVDDLSFRAGQHATAEGHDTMAEFQVISKHGATIKAVLSICVFEQGDA